jgi:hypothetical protein
VSDSKIDWIGLGKLGLPMAARIAAYLRETYSALIAVGEGEADFISTVPFAARLAGL